MRLELVPLPVSDVDRAKAFYEQVGFGNLHDTQVTETMRVVQLTPPGSSCAIVFGTGMGPITDMVPGSVNDSNASIQQANRPHANNYRYQVDHATTHGCLVTGQATPTDLPSWLCRSDSRRPL
jgi:predicted enzyme related to lactoylglutathione lyase